MRHFLSLMGWLCLLLAACNVAPNQPAATPNQPTATPNQPAATPNQAAAASDISMTVFKSAT